MRRRNMTVLILAATALLALTACVNVQAATPEPETRAISTSGTGRVSVTPDLLVARLGVDVRDRNLGVAIEHASNRIAAVTQSLTGAGVAEEDISTSRFTVNQIAVNPREPSQDDLIFQVRNIVSVKIRDVSRAGVIVSDAVEAGANRVESVTFTIEDDVAARSEARTKAVEKARANAQELANAAGATLGDVITISEGGGGAVSFAAPRAVFSQAVGGDVGIQPGQLDITVSVTVRYAIE